MLTVTKAEELQKTFAGQMIPETTARGLTNRFILENLRDGFCAGQPRFVLIGEEPAWSVPVIFPKTNGVTEAGEVLVHALTETILGFTPPTEIYRNARQSIA